MSSPETPIWNKLKNETRHAYAAFKLYRDYPQQSGGQSRSLDKTYRKFRGVTADQNLSASGRWSLWSKQHNWSARCDAFDIYQDNIEQAEREKRARQLANLKIDFEFQRQAAKQKRILDADVVLDQYQKEAAVSIRDLTQSKTTTETLGGQPRTTVTVTKFKAIKGGDYAKVLKIQSDLEERAGPGKAIKIEHGGTDGGAIKHDFKLEFADPAVARAARNFARTLALRRSGDGGNPQPGQVEDSTSSGVTQ